MRVITLKFGKLYTIESFPKSHRDFIKDCSHVGSVDADTKKWSNYFKVEDTETLRSFLINITNWDVSDDQENLERLLWIMACDLNEEGEFYFE